MDTLEPEVSKVCKEQQLLEQLDGEDLLDQSESEEDDKTVVMETSDLEDDTLDGGTDKSEMVEVPPVPKALTITKILTGANTIPVGRSVAEGGRMANADMLTSANSNTGQVGVGGAGSVPPLLPSPNTGKVGTREENGSISVQKHPLSRDGTYLAINLYRRAASSALNLLGGAPCIPPPEGGIFNCKLSRVSQCFIDFRFGEKFSIMASFCLNTMKCPCCKENTKVLEKRVAGRHVERRTLVLTDQHFPAALPATREDHQCLKIIRIENGTLWDLMNFLVDMVDKDDLGVPVGSALLLGSLSHLANVGTAVYLEELVQVQKRIFHRFEGTITFVPCPFFLVEGCNNPATIRSIFEVNAWLEAALTGETGYNLHLAATVQLQTNLMRNRGTGAATAAPVRLLLPSGMTSTTTGRTRWDSGGTNLPAGVPPLRSGEEEELVRTLIRELNSKLQLCLDPSPNLDPEVVGGGTASRREQYLVVGASNAKRCADALERRGHEVIRATIPGWSCVKSKIPEMEQLLGRKLLEASDGCVVVFQLLDSACHFTRTEEGGLLPARRGEDGRYHVLGESVFAPKELQYGVFNQAKPLLQMAGDIMKILICPLPRYLKDRCCGNKRHVSNLEEDNYGDLLEDAILASRKNMKDFAFRQGLQNIRVLGPWSSLRKVSYNVWEDDQVHITKEGFDTIAELVSTCANESRGMEAGGSSRLPKPNSSGGPSGSTDRKQFSGHREGGRGQGRRGRGFRH